MNFKDILGKVKNFFVKTFDPREGFLETRAGIICVAGTLAVLIVIGAICDGAYKRSQIEKAPNGSEISGINQAGDGSSDSLTPTPTPIPTQDPATIKYVSDKGQVYTLSTEIYLAIVDEYENYFSELAFLPEDNEIYVQQITAFREAIAEGYPENCNIVMQNLDGLYFDVLGKNKTILDQIRDEFIEKSEDVTNFALRKYHEKLLGMCDEYWVDGQYATAYVKYIEAADEFDRVIAQEQHALVCNGSVTRADGSLAVKFVVRNKTNGNVVTDVDPSEFYVYASFDKDVFVAFTQGQWLSASQAVEEGIIKTNEAVSLVYILTPPEGKKFLAISVLDAGETPMFCEK